MRYRGNVDRTNAVKWGRGGWPSAGRHAGLISPAEGGGMGAECERERAVQDSAADKRASPHVVGNEFPKTTRLLSFPVARNSDDF